MQFQTFYGINGGLCQKMNKARKKEVDTLLERLNLSGFNSNKKTQKVNEHKSNICIQNSPQKTNCCSSCR